MILCERCYDPKKHKGHEVTERVCTTDSGSCDSGRNLRINENSFCEAHRQKDVSVEISPQDENQFNEYIGSLFKIYLFLKDKNEEKLNNLEIALNDAINSLCLKSLYYARMTNKFLSTSFESSEGSSTYFLLLLKNITFAPLVNTLAADRYFLEKFAFDFCAEEETGKRNMFPFEIAREEIFGSKETVVRLMRAGIFIESKLSSYLKIGTEDLDQS